MRLHALNDLQLTLKHAHWNVVGPTFIGVHTMLDPQIDGIRTMVDDIAAWDDYDVMRADTRALLQDAGGQLSTQDATTEEGAAQKAS